MLLWDNASWHISHAVRTWLRQHNHKVKQTGQGVRIQLVFLAVFGFGAGLAGIAGIIGATFQSLSPGEDTRFLLASLVVVIVGGMGSIVGAALGALIIGVAEQMGFVYAPTYSVVFTFLIMAAVLAFRPQGLLGRR